MAGAIAWRAEDARQVLEMYQTLIEQAPPELTCVAVLRIAPPAPWLSKDVHGKPIVALFVCHTGPIKESAKLGSPRSKLSAPRWVTSSSHDPTYRSKTSSTRPSRKAGATTGSPNTCPRSSPRCSRTPSSMPKRSCRPTRRSCSSRSTERSTGFREDHSSVGNRDAACVLNITASWEHAEDDKANIEWARSAWRDMRSFSTGGTYVNFLTEEEGDERIHAAYGNNYERLVEVKTKWDPGNLFQMNKNIATRV